MRGENRLESSSIKYRISTNQMNQQSNRKEVENIMRKKMSAVRNHAKKGLKRRIHIKRPSGDWL